MLHLSYFLLLEHLFSILRISSLFSLCLFFFLCSSTFWKTFSNKFAFWNTNFICLFVFHWESFILPPEWILFELLHLKFLVPLKNFLACFYFNLFSFQFGLLYFFFNSPFIVISKDFFKKIQLYLIKWTNIRCTTQWNFTYVYTHVSTIQINYRTLSTLPNISSFSLHINPSLKLINIQISSPID